MKTMKRVPVLILLCLLAISSSADKPAPSGSGKAESAKSPAAASDGRPSFKLEKNLLKVRYGKQSFTIGEVFASDRPWMQWKPEDMVSPGGKWMIVPMADSSYQLYRLRAEKSEAELQGTIEGGVLWGGGSYHRARDHWTFTEWTDGDTLKLVGDQMSSREEECVVAEVNVEENVYTVTSKDGHEDQVSLRLVFTGRTGEMPYRYREPAKFRSGGKR